MVPSIQWSGARPQESHPRGLMLLLIPPIHIVHVRSIIFHLIDVFPKFRSFLILTSSCPREKFIIKPSVRRSSSILGPLNKHHVFFSNFKCNFLLFFPKVMLMPPTLYIRPFFLYLWSRGKKTHRWSSSQFPPTGRPSVCVRPVVIYLSNILFFLFCVCVFNPLSPLLIIILTAGQQQLTPKLPFSFMSNRSISQFP